jgi:hypothetical protein
LPRSCAPRPGRFDTLGLPSLCLMTRWTAILSAPVSHDRFVVLCSDTGVTLHLTDATCRRSARRPLLCLWATL